MLDYSLHENPLTERKDDFAAQTHVKTSYNKGQFIDLMLQRGTLMTKTDALAVLNNIEETVAYIVGNGGVVEIDGINVKIAGDKPITGSVIYLCYRQNSHGAVLF
jgi:hypothetical protein